MTYQQPIVWRNFDIVFVNITNRYGAEVYEWNLRDRVNGSVCSFWDTVAARFPLELQNDWLHLDQAWLFMDNNTIDPLMFQPPLGLPCNTTFHHNDNNDAAACDVFYHHSNDVDASGLDTA